MNTQENTLSDEQLSEVIGGCSGCGVDYQLPPVWLEEYLASLEEKLGN